MSGSLRLTCQVSDCGQPAAILVITTTTEVYCQGPFTGDHFSTESEDRLNVYPVCADHAPEEVHEARSSMGAGEYLVIDLPGQRPDPCKWGPGVPGAQEKRLPEFPA